MNKLFKTISILATITFLITACDARAIWASQSGTSRRREAHS